MEKYLWLALLGAGCSPLSALPPFHLHETAETLQRGGVSVTASGGLGVLGLDGHGGGGGLRARVGLGDQQELGVEASALFIDPDQGGSQDPKAWEKDSGAYAAKLSYKAAPARSFAVLLGAGGAYASTGGALGGDAALLLDTGRALKRLVRPYAALRFSFAVPVGRPIHQDGGLTLGLLPSLGVALVPHPRLRLFLEGYYFNAWAAVTPHKRDYHGGLGAALGVALYWDRSNPTHL